MSVLETSFSEHALWTSSREFMSLFFSGSAASASTSCSSSSIGDGVFRDTSLVLSSNFSYVPSSSSPPTKPVPPKSSSSPSKILFVFSNFSSSSSSSLSSF